MNVMRKLRFIILLILIIPKTSCVIIPGISNIFASVEEGVWKSEDPYIILYADTLYRSSIRPDTILGYTIVDNEKVKIFAQFERHLPGGAPSTFVIYDMEVINIQTEIGLFRSNYWDSLFSGLMIIPDEEPTGFFRRDWRDNARNFHIRILPEDQNTLHLRLDRRQSDDDSGEVIFHRLQNYDLINPENWFSTPPPSFELPSELTGIWESIEPNIILHLDAPILQERQDGIFYGVYTSNGNSIRASVLFTRTHPTFLNIIFPREYGISPLGGNFRVVDDELHFTLLPPIQEETGYDVIVFQRLKDYDTITP